MHTEKFWQTSFANFNISENLELIDKEIEYLRRHEGDHENVWCVRKAVICFDLGEFARYFPNGRTYLTMKGAKECINNIMKSNSATPELKKEAITAYQKILMKSWGQ